MRYYPLLLIATLLPAQAMALEPITEPHAMFYYQISLGGEGVRPKSHFGFRMDQANYRPGQMIDYHGLTQKPAVMDLRFNHQGVKSIKLAGKDYLEMYRVHRANGEDVAVEDESMQGGGEVMDEVAADVTAGETETTGEAGEVTDASTEGEAEIKKGNVITKVVTDVGATVGDVLEAAPVGFLIGGGILIVLLAGI